MRVSTYGLLCMLAGMLCQILIEYLSAPWYVNFTLGFAASMIMLGLVGRKVRED